MLEFVPFGGGRASAIYFHGDKLSLISSAKLVMTIKSSNI